MHDNRRVLPRFYAPDLRAGHDCPLPASEAHHLTRVLRLGQGTEVQVFDGRGSEYRAVIAHADRQRVVVRPLEALAAPPGPAVELILVQAVLKGAGMDDAVRDATMMGAAAIEPILTEHVDVKPDVARRTASLERWRRIALASVKQCRRATLPVIHPPRTFEEWTAQPSAETCLMFVEPSLNTDSRPLRLILEHSVPARAAVLVGPEGGWSLAEVQKGLAMGYMLVSLGPLTLRAESMAVAALSAITAIWS